MRDLTLQEINEKCRNDPAGFIGECEQTYHNLICGAAEAVCMSYEERPIILLNGPSSSGKTTTAKRIRDELERRGIHSHAISMDDYYLTRGTYQMPKNDEGQPDLESPLCMDLELLSRHLIALSKGEEIQVPQYNFAERVRTEHTEAVQLKKDEIAIIEGIHALNSTITEPLQNCSTGIYMAVGTQVFINSQYRLAPHQLRFVRRAIRDKNFRSEPILETVNVWKSVRRGERLYIHPFVPNAKWIIDTYLPYEDCILMNQLCGFAMKYVNEMHSAGLDDIIHALKIFEPMDCLDKIPEGSIMHEFIG